MENSRAITVSQLNNYIKQVFDAESLLHGVEVVGEVSGLRNGYFSLKDKDATINCVCYYPSKLEGIKDGEQVFVRGTIGYWHKAGKISFVVQSVESFGFGALFLQFEKLKKKLESEGYFAIKKTLPDKVQRIGVVTSKHGAVLHDIKTVVSRRNPNVDIVLYPVAVQGMGVEREIASAIAFFGHYNVDVVIVARGGGSAEDLAAFNTEIVARSVFECSVPVVSAVGHETDWTLIDFVADLRAATPSAAAELVTPEFISAKEKAVQAYKRMRYVMMDRAERFFDKSKNLWVQFKSEMNYKIDGFESKLKGLLGLVEANNPLAILKKGYAKVLGVSSVDDVQVGDNLDVRLYNGVIGVKVCKK